MNNADLDAVYKHIQQMFSSGLTTIIGSGLSSSHGLPGMGALAQELVNEVPPRLSLDNVSGTAWNDVLENLNNGQALEDAMSGLPADDPCLPHIIRVTGDAISRAEMNAMTALTQPNQSFPLRQLVHYITKTGTAADVITTNYDRLIELACALAAVPIDTGFAGNSIGYYDESASREQLTGLQRDSRGKTMAVTKPHVRLAKPHGSLDWYTFGGNPVRSEVPFESRRLIITPGLSKYKSGYERPFDAQKNRATEAIDRAAALLFIGYGFNDDHLQTHLSPQFAKKTRTTIIARTLTTAALDYIGLYPHILAIEAWPGEDASSRVYNDGKITKVENAQLWDLGSFITEVLL